MTTRYPAPASRTAGGRGQSSRKAILVVLVVAVGVASFVILDFQGLSEYLACPHTCPSDFAPVGIERTAVGSPGCAEPTTTVCYRAEFASTIGGLTLSGLRFNVANPANQKVDPNAPEIPLGPSASVSALDSAGRVVGVWSLHSTMWQSGSSSPVSTSSDTVVILDTGLQSNATLSNAYFYVILTTPNHGAIALPLFCSGC